MGGQIRESITIAVSEWPSWRIPTLLNALPARPHLSPDPTLGHLTR